MQTNTTEKNKDQKLIHAGSGCETTFVKSQNMTSDAATNLTVLVITTILFLALIHPALIK
jgi:hypothetical protein